MVRIWTLIACLFALSAHAEETCGVDRPCAIGTGTYYVATPPGWDERTPAPVIVFFHGHRSSGSAVMKGSMRETFTRAGYVVVAPDGAMLPGSEVRAWPARPGFGGGRDDIAFTFAVLDDLESRMPIDRNRIVVGGFSAGASQAWMIGCYSGGKIAAVIAVSGALRRPVPEGGCPGGPFRVLHIHGFSDRQVPLEGRAIRDWHQGDVFESLSLARGADACPSLPSRIWQEDIYRCREWTECGSGRDIRFCLHDGGHMLPKGWAPMALDWLENGPKALN